MMRITFLIGILFTIPIISHATKFCSKYKCEKTKGDVKIGHFAGKVINDRFLNDTAQKQFNAESESICVRKCVKDGPCRTISVVPDMTSTENVTCYLSESDIYNTDHVFQKGSKIILLGTDKCSTSPCPEGSKCEPNYETGGYSCSDIRPDIYFSFDKDLEPEYKAGAIKKLSASSKKGSIVKIYDAKTPVLMMADGSDLKFSHNIQYLGNPLIVQRNLTLGMWVKYSGVNDVEVYVISSQSIWALRFTNGLYDLFINKNGGKENLKYQMPDIRSYNIWHHIVFRVTKDVMKFTVNGETRAQKDISLITHYKPNYGIFTLQQTSTKGIVGFLDSVSINNDYKSDKFVKEWYEREKKNYA